MLSPGPGQPPAVPGEPRELPLGREVPLRVPPQTPGAPPQTGLVRPAAMASLRMTGMCRSWSACIAGHLSSHGHALVLHAQYAFSTSWIQAEIVGTRAGYNACGLSSCSCYATQKPEHMAISPAAGEDGRSRSTD